jgi:TRAP-type C4-dicarboxylate transport system permease small subunit
MSVLVGACKRLSGWMNTFGGIVLFLMMMLTVMDVILRLFGNPITGTYELVAMAGAVVVAFAIPQTSWDNAHIYVDFLLENRSPAVKKAFQSVTKLLGVILFALLAWYLFAKATHLYRSGDVSLTLHIPYYPVAYGLAFCSIVQSVVLVFQIVTLFENGDNNG